MEVNIDKELDSVKRLNNIMQFVEYTTIIGGFGWPYRKAIRMLYEGYDLPYVLSWYDSQLKIEGNNCNIDK